MGEARSHAIVIGFRKEDLRRFQMRPAALVDAGKCIGCSHHVYLNWLGVSAIRERDADVCCDECESRYHAEINRALIES